MKSAENEKSQKTANPLASSSIEVVVEKENNTKILNKVLNYKEIIVPNALSASLPLKNTILKENTINLQNKLNIGRLETFQERRKEKREFGSFQLFYLEEEDEKHLFDLGVKIKFSDRKNAIP
jgi:hypothetical protein